MMPIKHRKFILALAALSIAAPAAAQTFVFHQVQPAKGFSDVHVSKAAAPGQQVRIWYATMLNPDCTAMGSMSAQIIEQPQHGQAIVSDGSFYPTFLPPNPRAVCNSRRVPGKEAYYTSAANFRGRDRVVIRNATSEGRMRNVIVDIDVR